MTRSPPRLFSLTQPPGRLRGTTLWMPSLQVCLSARSRGTGASRLRRRSALASPWRWAGQWLSSWRQAVGGHTGCATATTARRQDSGQQQDRLESRPLVRCSALQGPPSRLPYLASRLRPRCDRAGAASPSHLIGQPRRQLRRQMPCAVLPKQAQREPQWTCRRPPLELPPVPPLPPRTLPLLRSCGLQ